MRDFHSLSVTEQLYRLAEIAHQPYTRSTRERRACVALIFRLAPSTTPPTPPPTTSLPPPPVSAPTPPPQPSPYSRYLDPTPSYPRLIDALHSLATNHQQFIRHSALELLFIQRARNPTDRWSGQMALPGGRQQSGETDYQTAVREVEEEIGLRLGDGSGSGEVLYLGRMSDRHISSFGNVKPLAVCPFIFLLTSPIPPTLRLDSKEVGAVVWTPLSYFTRHAVRFGYMVHPLVIQTRDRWQRHGGRRKVEVGYRVKRMDNSLSAPSLVAPAAPSSTAAGSAGGVLGLLPVKLPTLFSLPSVHFPALALPGEFETADGRRGISLGDTLIYHPTTSRSHAYSSSASSSSSSSLTAPSPLLSTPVPPTSALPIRSADDSPDSPAMSSDDELSSSKMEHDISVESGTFILWGFTLLLVSDLLRDGLGVRSLSVRIDAGKDDRARMLQWLHRSIDAMDRVGKGWREMKEASMRMVSGGESAVQQQQQASEQLHMQDERHVAASLSKSLAAANNSNDGKKEGGKPDNNPIATLATLQPTLLSKL